MAAAAVYMQPSCSHRASGRRGRKSNLPPAVVDAKMEGRRVSGEVLHALLDQLGYRAPLLLLTSAATSDEPHRVLLGPAAANAPFIGTLALGLEEAHYQLMLSRPAPPRVGHSSHGGDGDDGGGGGDATMQPCRGWWYRGRCCGRGARRLKSAVDMERALHRDAQSENRRDAACHLLAQVHNLGHSRELLPWVRGGGRKAKGGTSTSASPASDESSTGHNELVRRVRQRVREPKAPGARDAGDPLDPRRSHSSWYESGYFPSGLPVSSLALVGFESRTDAIVDP